MRQFLAIEVPAAMRDRMGELQQRLARCTAGFRWVRPESIHLTLRFLGQVPQPLDADARPAWARAARAGAAFRLQVSELGVFPPRGAPRVLWLGLTELGGEGGRLERLANALEQAARDLGFPPQERAFRAHLTLGRARGAASRPPPDVGWAVPEPFEVAEVTLFESRLHPAGARYTALARYPLGARR